MPAWKWMILKFCTRAHFMRLIATLIILIAGFQSLYYQKIEDTWLILVGAVMNHYFNHKEAANVTEEDKNPDDECKVG
jgi:hypothetical protein